MQSINKGDSSLRLSSTHSIQDISEDFGNSGNYRNSGSSRNSPRIKVLDKNVKNSFANREEETFVDRFSWGIKQLLHGKAIWEFEAHIMKEKIEEIQKKIQRNDRDVMEMDCLMLNLGFNEEKYKGCIEKIDWAKGELEKIKELEKYFNERKTAYVDALERDIEMEDRTPLIRAYRNSLDELEKCMHTLWVTKRPYIVPYPALPVTLDKLPVKKHRKIKELKIKIEKANERRGFLENQIEFCKKENTKFCNEVRNFLRTGGNENNDDMAKKHAEAIMNLNDCIGKYDNEIDSIDRDLKIWKKEIKIKKGTDELELQILLAENRENELCKSGNEIKKEVNEIRTIKDKFYSCKREYLENKDKSRDLELYEVYLGSWGKWRELQHKLQNQSESSSSLVVNDDGTFHYEERDFSKVYIPRDQDGQIKELDWMQEHMNIIEVVLKNMTEQYLDEKEPQARDEIRDKYLLLKKNLQRKKIEYIDILLKNKKKWRLGAYEHIFDISGKAVEMYGVTEIKQVKEVFTVQENVFTEMKKLVIENKEKANELEGFFWNARCTISRIFMLQIQYIKSIDLIEKAKNAFPLDLQMPIKMPTMMIEKRAGFTREQQEKWTDDMNKLHEMKNSWAHWKVVVAITEMQEDKSHLEEAKKTERMYFDIYGKKIYELFDLQSKLDMFKSIKNKEELGIFAKEISNLLYEEKCLIFGGAYIYIAIYEKISEYYLKFTKEEERSIRKIYNKELRENVNIRNVGGNVEMGKKKNNKKNNKKNMKNKKEKAQPVKEKEVRNIRQSRLNTNSNSNSNLSASTFMMRLEANAAFSFNMKDKAVEQEPEQDWISVKRAPPGWTGFTPHDSAEMTYLRNVPENTMRGQMLERRARNIWNWSQDCMAGNMTPLTAEECLALVDWIIFSSRNDKETPLIRDKYMIRCSDATGEFAGAPDGPDAHLKLSVDNGIRIPSRHQFLKNGKRRMQRPTLHLKVKKGDMPRVQDGLVYRGFPQLDKNQD